MNIRQHRRALVRTKRLSWVLLLPRLHSSTIGVGSRVLHQYLWERSAKEARLTLFQFNLHLTIRALAFCPLHPRPATGLGLASMPNHSLDRIQEPGVT
jgi:hypothetical protein